MWRSYDWSLAQTIFPNDTFETTATTTTKSLTHIMRLLTLKIPTIAQPGKRICCAQWTDYSARARARSPAPAKHTQYIAVPHPNLWHGAPTVLVYLCNVHARACYVFSATLLCSNLGIDSVTIYNLMPATCMCRAFDSLLVVICQMINKKKQKKNGKKSMKENHMLFVHLILYLVLISIQSGF